MAAAAELIRLAEVREAARSGAARELRIEARLSLREVGAACGVSEVTVLRWERNERRPRGAAALRYGAVLRALAKRQSPETREAGFPASEPLADENVDAHGTTP
jgi:transcriptional regulator with XRE-family HTH domain